MCNLFVFMTTDRSGLIKVPDNVLCDFPPLVAKVEVKTARGFDVIVQVFAGSMSNGFSGITGVPLIDFFNLPLVKCEKSIFEGYADRKSVV